MSCTRPIGFMDSGVGGLSVLQTAVRMLPHENFIYYGDSGNAPYGRRPKEEILQLTLQAVEFILHKQAKAIVIACNTATIFAIDELRRLHPDIPIIGTQPAVKPAAIISDNSKIIIMATPMTLRSEKLSQLVRQYASNKEVIPMICPGLVELIESGQSLNNDCIHQYFQNLLHDYLCERVVVVLGCTHFPFVKPVLKQVLTKESVIIDGASGTSHQLINQLQAHNLLNKTQAPGQIEIFNSHPDERFINLSQQLLNSQID